MDIIDRLNDGEMCIDAIDDAITIIEKLRAACAFGGLVVKGPDLLEKAAATIEARDYPGVRYMSYLLREKARMERAAIAKAANT